MACINYKNANYKSALKTYNSAPQAVTASLTQLNILGSACTDTGCAISSTTSAANVNCKGLYHISADVTITPTAAGAEIVQLYNGTTALPCAISQFTVAASTIYTTHIETDLVLSPCANVTPSINVKTFGVAGVVNFVGFSMVKLA